MASRSRDGKRGDRGNKRGFVAMINGGQDESPCLAEANSRWEIRESFSDCDNRTIA
jgi:hypothetical protein